MNHFSRSKRIRLPAESYQTPGLVWHITTVTHLREPVFLNPEMADIAGEALEFQCTKAASTVLVYCVMPDHVHAVIATSEVDVVTIMQRFKSYTAHVWKKRTGQTRLWQPSFHDHGVRHTEKIDDLVGYIIENPVRSGLVESWQEYPWTGGILVRESKT